MRYAVYLTPQPDDALTEAARRWLGRCAFTGAETPPDAPAIARPEVPARYGFHATMRAPFRLRPDRGERALFEWFDRFATEWGEIPVTLEIATIGNFVALVAPDQSAIDAAHRAALEAFEPLRAPLDAADLARRNPDRLDDRGRALLDAWGYPYVLERFRFHMTLSGPLEAGDIAPVRDQAAAYFAPFVGVPQRLVFGLFAEVEAGGPFTVVAGATAARRAAE